MLFKEQPRTQSEAESQGYILMDSGCTDRFLGHRYAHPDDESIILIFDDAGKPQIFLQAKLNQELKLGLFLQIRD